MCRRMGTAGGGWVRRGESDGWDEENRSVGYESGARVRGDVS